MSKNRGITSFLFLGNDECLDFINTEVTERGKTIELLSNFGEFADWLFQMDYIDPGIRTSLLEKGEPEQERDLGKVREFRAHLRRLIEAVASGKPLIMSYLEPINEALVKDASYNKLILIDSEPHLISHSSSKEYDPLSPIACAASDLLTKKDLKLVKKCEGKGCELYFYDESKNHARRWCSMKRCGNRMKAALHYKKKRRGITGVSKL